MKKIVKKILKPRKIKREADPIVCPECNGFGRTGPKTSCEKCLGTGKTKTT